MGSLGARRVPRRRGSVKLAGHGRFHAASARVSGVTESVEVAFGPGQLVRHELFDYRGVVVDVDPTFGGSDEWYETVARSRPPKDAPWYHVLPHGAEHTTYVAERNLRAEGEPAPIQHPLVEVAFESFRDGRYVPRGGLN